MASSTIARQTPTGKGHLERRSARPDISVIVATTHPWPAARATLDELHEQLDPLDGQLILADGDGAGLTADAEALYPGIAWLKRRGASVFELRALGASAARGEVVALTEDHVLPGKNWCRRLLEIYEHCPDIKAVSGPIENGSPRTRVDWANFLMTFSSFAGPLRPQPDRVPPPANISYRRSVLPPFEPEPGWLELTLTPKLFNGHTIIVDQRASVAHVQPVSLGEALQSHFHNGRITTGLLPVTEPNISRGAIILRGLRRPAEIVNQVVAGSSGKRQIRRKVLASSPVIVMLATSHALGETVGLLRGSGNSANALE
jgi:hypothetical protein